MPRLMFVDSPLLAIVLVVLAAVSVVDVIRNWQVTFDARFTTDDRLRVMRLVLFVLLPLSVLAHEGGHALAVKAFGGEVVDFGFYLVYGFVGHVGVYTPLERALIAFAGTFVNVVLGLAAIAIAWYRPWPRRPAVNYLLFAFGALSLANALVFYPLIDALGGVAGDWETIYSRDTPVFSVLIGLGHLALLVAAVIIWRNPRFQAGYAARTGGRMTEPASAGSTGDAGQPGDEQKELAGILTVAAALATNDWRHPVTLASDMQSGGSQVIVRWESGGFQRALLVHATPSGAPEQHVEVHAAIESTAERLPPYHRALARIDGRPTAHELVPYVRRYLDFVDTWDGASVVSPN
jgi:hypothetical protein